MEQITLFSWGYWGWGNATQQLTKAVDAVEAARGFNPPLFIDIRIRRSVRAPGFVGDAFGKLVGQSRYVWMRSLGNKAVLRGSGPAEIADPAAAEDLLDGAIEASKRKQRVLFFCACEFPRKEGHINCHRVMVASLVLKSARRRKTPIEIVEWPGGHPQTIDLALPVAGFRKLLRGGTSVRLGNETLLSGYAGLPWGSTVRVRSEARQCVVVTGPAKYRKHGWYLPVHDRADDLDVNAPLVKAKTQRLRSEFGFEPRTVKIARRHNEGGLSEYCIYTIAHLDKLKKAVGQTTPVSLSEARPWSTAGHLLADAKRAGRQMAILFGDANACSRLISWGILRDLQVWPHGTRYTFTDLRPLRGRHSPQELRLRSTGRRIALGFIKPYAICHTPDFL